MDLDKKNEYGIKVAMFIENPKYMGTISDEEAKELGAAVHSFTYGSKEVGYELTLHWAIKEKEDMLVLARYTYDGVMSGIAVNHMMALILSNKTMAQIETINYPALEKLLRDNPNIPALPEEESFTIVYAIDAAKLAVLSYIKRALNHEESTVPCKTSPMSIASLKEVISEQNIQSLETLAKFTQAGTADESCNEDLLAFIEEGKIAAKEKEEADKILNAVPFKDLSPDHRIIAVETAIDNTVRQFLVMDGGDIDILSVKEKDDQYEVYISYLGACSSCDSSGSGTLIAIENALKDKLDPNIRVIPI